MANATGLRYTADRPVSDQDRARRELGPQETTHSIGNAVGGISDAERHATLIALATPELDRVYEKLAGSGYSLMLTDASGLVLYERSERAPPLTVTPEQAKEAHEPLTLEDLAGEDPQMLRNARSAYRIADSNVSVLIQGPTGSGKEAFAHAMHLASSRASRPFVAVNCAAIPRELVASELFGHEKGAFTGATQRRIGRFELANGGTISLDEVGELSPDAQVALLRVLQERELERVGGRETIHVDVRVIAATNRDLM